MLTVVAICNLQGRSHANHLTLYTKMEKNTATWHVLCVKPNTERKVGKLLEKAGFEVCVPTYKELRYRSDRKVWIEKVVFNCYVFVAVLPKKRKNVFINKNIFQYLKTGDRIAVLKEEEVKLIKKISTTQESVSISSEALEVGQYVEILSGDFAGLQGMITALQQSNKPKVHLEISSLACFVCVELLDTSLKLVTTE